MTYLVLNQDTRTVAKECSDQGEAMQWVKQTRAQQRRKGLTPASYRVIPVRRQQ